MSVESISRQPDKVVVELLESYLELAKSGEIIGIVLIAEKAGNRQRMGRAGSIDDIKMLGTMEWCKWTYLREWVGYEDLSEHDD
jgi:hypothetical protein